MSKSGDLKLYFDMPVQNRLEYNAHAVRENIF